MGDYLNFYIRQSIGGNSDLSVTLIYQSLQRIEI